MATCMLGKAQTARNAYLLCLNYRIEEAEMFVCAVSLPTQCVVVTHLLCRLFPSPAFSRLVNLMISDRRIDMINYSRLVVSCSCPHPSIAKSS